MSDERRLTANLEPDLKAIDSFGEVNSSCGGGSFTILNLVADNIWLIEYPVGRLEEQETRMLSQDIDSDISVGTASE